MCVRVGMGVFMACGCGNTNASVRGSQRTTAQSRSSLYTLHGFQGSHSSVKTCTASTFTQWSILLTLIVALLDTALYVRGVRVVCGPCKPLSNWATEMLLWIGSFCSFKDQMWQFLQSSSMLLEDDSTGSHHMVFVICCGLKANRQEWKHTLSVYLCVWKAY